MKKAMLPFTMVFAFILVTFGTLVFIFIYSFSPFGGPASHFSNQNSMVRADEYYYTLSLANFLKTVHDGELVSDTIRIAYFDCSSRKAAQCQADTDKLETNVKEYLKPFGENCVRFEFSGASHKWYYHDDKNCNGFTTRAIFSNVIYLPTDDPDVKIKVTQTRFEK